jgi:hypothetical protein
MNPSLIVSGSHRLLIAPPVGPIVARVQDALDLIGEALSRGATIIVMPVERLDPAFFVLSSGLAGEVTQKIVNYRLKLAVIGDISTQTANSSALRAFVRESNRGRSIFFAQDLESLAAALSMPRGEDV